MAIVEFNRDIPTPEDIHEFYEECVKGIEDKFNPKINPYYTTDFAFLTKIEIEQNNKRMREEVSLRAAFFLLAYIETLFRTDFALRVESHKKGRKNELTRMYKNEYNPTKKIYSYSLKDFIFEKWKLYADNLPYSKEMLEILRILPQYFDFRNWMAHGRYWRYKESNYIRKYNYTQIKILLGDINLYFGSYLQKKKFT